MTENKGDLISRSEAEKLGATCLARRNENGQLEAIISLDNAPTVELDENVIQEVLNKRCMTTVANEYLIALHGKRPQGEWVEVEKQGKTGDGRIFTYTIVVCSECGEQYDLEGEKFCPHCGAKMKEEADRL